MVVTYSTSEASLPRPSRNVLVSLSVVLRSLFADALITNTFIVSVSNVIISNLRCKSIDNRSFRQISGIFCTEM